jgi:HEAT repeat protein
MFAVVHGSTRLTPPCLALVLVAALAITTMGCQSMRLSAVGQPADASAAPAAPPPAHSAPAESADKTPAPKVSSAEQVDGWNAWAAVPPTDPAQGHRWRHLALEKVISRPADERPDFIALLASGNDIVAANAAISLARLGDARGREVLLRTVRSPTLRLPLRSAAAEALAGLDQPSAIAELRELLDRYGRFDDDPTGYLPELHAELLYGLARHVDAGSDERFSAALKSPAPTVRLAAVRAWTRAGTSVLPPTAADLRTDQDQRVRAAALEAMAVRHHPQALEAAQSALADYRVEVRLAAVAAVGRWGGPDARRILSDLKREPEVVRAAAIQALAEIGARDEIAAEAESPSWRVRRAVAEALARWPDASGIALARQFITDGSVEVQKQLVETLAAWPPQVAAPVLLEVMKRGGYLARKTAATKLREHWPPAADFLPDAPAERRAEMLATLERRWHQEHSASPASLAMPSTAARLEESPGPERLALAVQIIERLRGSPPTGEQAEQAINELQQFGPDLPAVVEVLVCQRDLALPENVYRQVLPRFGESFADLDRLASPDTQQRRRAAGHLAAGVMREPLSYLAVARLADIGAREADVLVWHGMMRAVERDAREPAVRLAYAGLGHDSGEVRRLAAEHLARHPAAEHVRLLLPALHDTNQAVVLAAIEALGQPGVLDDPAPLERLLTARDRKLRLAIVRSLLRLGAESGPRTLDLLAHEPDGDLRRQAALLMGDFPDDQYTGTLVGLLDDTLAVRLAALTSLPKVAGQDVGRPAGEPTTSTLDQIGRWKQWWSTNRANN